MAQQSQSQLVRQTHTVLLPEIISFSPNFLLDDIINIANDGVGRAVDAMEDFLNRWAETRLEQEPAWDADKELEQGLVSFQTLLEFHTDIAFDFFEAWSLRNIFAVTPDLPLVVPHHAGLHLDQPQEIENELLAEIDQLYRQIENVRCPTLIRVRPDECVLVCGASQQKRLNRLLAKTTQASRRRAKKARARFDCFSFIQPDQLRVLHGLAKDEDSLYSHASALSALDPAKVDVPGLEPGKREWEVGKTGYLSWASAKLIQQAQLGGATAEEATATASKGGDVAMVLLKLKGDD